jgi:hypothetical protein
MTEYDNILLNTLSMNPHALHTALPSRSDAR